MYQTGNITPIKQKQPKECAKENSKQESNH